jgi:hypothetical protein
MYLGHHTDRPTKDGGTTACVESRGRVEGTEAVALQDPCAMVRAVLLESQYPCGESALPRDTVPKTHRYPVPTSGLWGMMW